jgi:hypothetical protein
MLATGRQRKHGKLRQITATIVENGPIGIIPRMSVALPLVTGPEMLFLLSVFLA